jgi:hypothetical protein
MPRGIPDMLMLNNNQAKRINTNSLPGGTDAVELYRKNGGHLTDPGTFGIDPIGHSEEKCSIRQSAFFDKFNSFDLMFHELVNENPARFKEEILFYIDITRRLSASSNS